MENETEEQIKNQILSETWHIHTATGCSIRTESGRLVFEYPMIGRTFDDRHYNRWLDCAAYVCDLHNQTINQDTK